MGFVAITIGFDLDMTLIDSRPAILDAFAALSDEVGVRIDLEQVDARLGIKLEAELANWFGPSDLPAAAETTIGRRWSNGQALE